MSARRRIHAGSGTPVEPLRGTANKFPITSALNNLKGQYFVDQNLVAAASLLVALPTPIVFFALQKQFISGLTLGSTKG